MNTSNPEFRRRFKPLLMAVHLFMESQVWLLKFSTETASNLSDSQKHAILGQIECAVGVLQLVRQQIDELPPLPEA